jgi:hypothetical protein
MLENRLFGTLRDAMGVAISLTGIYLAKAAPSGHSSVHWEKILIVIKFGTYAT